MAYTELAQLILSDAEKLDDYIKVNKLPRPSLDANGPAQLSFGTPEASEVHSTLLANTHKLFHLVQGPIAAWTGTMNGGLGDVMTIAAISHFKLAEHVPSEGSAPFQQVAEKAGMAVRDFSMIVRYAMTNFIFCEPQPGFIAHTISSKVLAENKLIQSLAEMGLNEIFPSVFKGVEALRTYPGSEEPNESSWAIANNARSPMFTELQVQHPKRAENMAFAMETLAKQISDSVIVGAYDWASLGPATLVDVGGANAGRNQLPSEFNDRIKFMTHDFFTPQSVKNADVYYFRAVFHNWPDKYSILILQSLIPALKKGARVIIHDPHTPDPLTMHPWQERQSRASNLRMKVLFNSFDRESSDYPDLFAKADPRFRINTNKAHQRALGQAVGPTLALVEATWEG